MKKLTMMLIVMICALSLSACTGFNNVMYAELSDATNYDSYQITVQDIIWSDDGGAILKVTFDNYEDVSIFLGGTPNQDIPLGEYVFSMKIIEENVQILTGNGFFDEIKPGDMVEVRAAAFIYSDSDFFYVAALSSNEKVYLDFEAGLQNMIAMMDAHRSVF